MAVFGAAIGAVVGAVAGAVTSAALNIKNAEAYKTYAKDIRKAAEKYSGDAAYKSMYNKGLEEGMQTNRRSLDAAASMEPSNKSAMMANTTGLQGANTFNQGFNQGAENQKALNTAKYNAETAKAQQALNQANIEYKAGTAATQGAMNTLGGLATAYNNLKPASSNTTSDENVKEYDNHNGLPKADVEDALRQIESISYKYKDGLGLDQDHHVGVTAQSLEGTAFDDVVSENEEGIKQLDKQKLQESVMAGIAALQKEIDELKGGNNDSK